MTRTLADMTPEERAACVGRWCDIPHEYGPAILHIKKSHNLGWGLIAPATNSVFTWLPEDITPRFDLPRAWTPDGEPVGMEEEWGEVAFGRIWLDASWRTHLPEDTPVRRYVTDWKEA